jgi:hypothetical protein
MDSGSIHWKHPTELGAPHVHLDSSVCMNDTLGTNTLDTGPDIDYAAL